MSKRTPATDPVPPTDEWGIYDPAKAGMQALYARLGRPVIRASAKKQRQERRRGFRQERTNDGVGLAIEEAMRRAGIMEAKAEADPSYMPVSPASAVRAAMRAARPKSPAVLLVAPAPEPVALATPEPVIVAVPEAAPKRKVTRRAKVVGAPVVATPPVVAAAVEPPVKARAARKTAKARIKAEPVAAVATAPVAPPAPPAPSPRRPRGVVPLAAWAHAVSHAPKVEPRRGDKRGFWRGIFRMPADVALVEYAHGARIHRLLIETTEDVALPELL